MNRELEVRLRTVLSLLMDTDNLMLKHNRLLNRIDDIYKNTDFMMIGSSKTRANMLLSEIDAIERELDLVDNEMESVLTTALLLYGDYRNNKDNNKTS